jgi:hypothetical protein
VGRPESLFGSRGRVTIQRVTLNRPPTTPPGLTAYVRNGQVITDALRGQKQLIILDSTMLGPVVLPDSACMVSDQFPERNGMKTVITITIQYTANYPV